MPRIESPDSPADGPHPALTGTLETIARKLEQARAENRQPFGESHKLTLRPPLTEAQVAAIEGRIRAALPEEYRAFVTRLGDGGAGPAYGVFRLEQALDHSKLDKVPDLLALPFPHQEAYNPDTDPVVLDLYNRVDRGEARENEADAQYDRQLAGALELCDEGCGHTHFLVFTGPARGTMWIDSRGADQGFLPLRVTFLAWYERWVDDVLAGGRGTWWLGDPVGPTGAPDPSPS